MGSFCWAVMYFNGVQLQVFFFKVSAFWILFDYISGFNVLKMFFCVFSSKGLLILPFALRCSLLGVDFGMRFFFFSIEKICISSWPSTICWSCLPFPSALCRYLHYKLSSCMWELYVRVCFRNLYSISSFWLPLCQYCIVLVLYCYNGSGYLVVQVFQKHCFTRLFWPFLGCFSI